MCELLALQFNRPVYPDFSFREFQQRGVHHPHGWGLAWFEHPGRCSLHKEAMSAHESPLAASLLDHPPGPSCTFLGHVRYQTKGNRSFLDAHPFVQRFHHRDIALAHNGTLEGLPPTRRTPRGTTDSEHLLCLLLDRLEDQRADFEDNAAVKSILWEINKHGTVSLIFTDGVTLYAYRDKNGKRPLYRTLRQPPFRTSRLKGDGFTLDLAKIKSPDTVGHLFASKPLTDEAWDEIPPGELGQYTIHFLRPGTASQEPVP